MIPRHTLLALTPNATGGYHIAQSLVHNALAHNPVPDIVLPHKINASSPRVIVPLRECAANENHPAMYELPRGYDTLLFTRGLTLDFLPPVPDMGTDHPLVQQALANASGALYIGGYDIEPRWYGATAHPKTQALEQHRDKLEISIFVNYILRDKLPFLGICRGVQVLNIALGGSLHQHIPDLCADEEHYQHSWAPGEDARHTVRFDTRSRAYNTLKRNDALLNSHHHQAINRIGSGLRVTGQSSAGIAEVVESTDTKHWCFGVQGHPERDDSADLAPLIDSFATAVHARRNR